jgi:hypothetical protein
VKQGASSSSSRAGPHPRDLVEFGEATNRQGGHYHRIDYGGGLVLEGEYDMARYVPSFRVAAGTESEPGRGDHDALHGVVHGFVSR